MKLPFVSRKKYEIARNNLKKMQEARTQLEKDYIKYQKEQKEINEKRNLAYSQMEDNCKQLCDRLEFMEEEMKDLKNEIKRLKTLCTKNGIIYDKKES